MYLLLWVIFGFVTAMIASNKGYSGFAGFIVGVLLGPLGILIYFFMKSNQAEVERQSISSGEQRKCPHCAELVKAEATKCKHCQSDLDPIVKPTIKQVNTPRVDPADFTQICKACGASYSYYIKNCDQCGAK